MTYNDCVQASRDSQYKSDRYKHHQKNNLYHDEADYPVSHLGPEIKKEHEAGNTGKNNHRNSLADFKKIRVRPDVYNDQHK